MGPLSRLPPGIALNPLSQRVVDLLERNTVFPWPVLMAQCKRFNVDPAALTPATLAPVVDAIADGVARFTSPAKGDEVRRALHTLCRTG